MGQKVTQPIPMSYPEVPPITEVITEVVVLHLASVAPLVSELPAAMNERLQRNMSFKCNNFTLI